MLYLTFIAALSPHKLGVQSGGVEQTGVFNFYIKGKRQKKGCQRRYTTLHSKKYMLERPGIPQY